MTNIATLPLGAPGIGGVRAALAAQNAELVRLAQRLRVACATLDENLAAIAGPGRRRNRYFEEVGAATQPAPGQGDIITSNAMAITSLAALVAQVETTVEQLNG